MVKLIEEIEDVESIDLTKTFELISACSCLRELELFPGELIINSALNLRNLTNIEKLTVISSDARGIDFPGHYNKLPHLPKLRELYAETYREEEPILELGKCTTLEKLSFFCRDLDFTETIPELPKMKDLKNLSNLKELSVCFRDEANGIETALDRFSRFTNLVRLHLSTNEEGFLITRLPECHDWKWIT